MGDKLFLNIGVGGKLSFSEGRGQILFVVGGEGDDEEEDISKANILLSKGATSTHELELFGPVRPQNSSYSYFTLKTLSL